MRIKRDTARIREMEETLFSDVAIVWSFLISFIGLVRLNCSSSCDVLHRGSQLVLYSFQHTERCPAVPTFGGFLRFEKVVPQLVKKTKQKGSKCWGNLEPLGSRKYITLIQVTITTKLIGETIARSVVSYSKGLFLFPSSFLLRFYKISVYKVW